MLSDYYRYDFILKTLLKMLYSMSLTADLINSDGYRGFSYRHNADNIFFN